MSEKYILTVKAGMHFGYIKETFHAGSVIEFDDVNKKLIIDGRKFDDTRDLDIMKRQALKFPQNPWIVPFSEELMEEIRENKPVVVETQKPRPGENMQIIKSDSDLNEPIDISSTQVSKINNAAKEAARNKVKQEGMPIIRGDESVEDRLASLKDKTDINSMAERVRLKQSAAKMTIVHDDSLGAGVSRTATPLNAGQSLPSREVVDAKSEETRLLADARKREIEARRKASGVEVPAAPEQAPVAPAKESPTSIEMGDNDTDASKESEIIALKAKIAALEADAAKKTVVRKPVTNPEQAKEITGKQ